MPFFGQFFIVQDRFHNSCSENWRASVHWSYYFFQPRINIFCLLLIIGYYRQTACSLSVKSKVFAKTLKKHNPIGFLCKEAHGISICIKIAGGKTLISIIKPCKVALSNHYIGNLAPLLMRRVATSWIVCTSMQHHNLFWLGFVNIF